MAGTAARGPVGRRGTYSRWGKRLLDVLVASAVLVLLAPLLGLIAAAVFLSLGSPVLFSEPRAGLRGTPFRFKKFRTMTEDRDAGGRMLPDGQRLTPLGRLLRQTSLDELPELVHVVRGEMSLVGPRPLPVRYVPRYSTQQARRLEVKPGITGPAQIFGRNALSWEDRFALDVSYVDQLSLRVDLTILRSTAMVVARRKGVSHPGHATMYEFTGSPQ